MSRFEQIKDATGNSELEGLYQEMAEYGWATPDGVPVNWLTSQAERPDILEATWGFARGTLMQGQLPPTVKQMIAMVIAKQNDCRYCEVSHTYALEALGVPQNVIQSCASDPDLTEVPPPQRAMMRVALKANSDPKSVTDDDIQSLRDQGLSDGEIIEVLMVAAFAIFGDFWADVSGIMVEGEE